MLLSLTLRWIRPHYLHSPHCELSLSPRGEYLRDTRFICRLTKTVPVSNPVLPTHTNLLAAHLRLDFFSTWLLFFFCICWKLNTLCTSQKWIVVNICYMIAAKRYQKLVKSTVASSCWY